ncbi:tetratricopeptide repeat protein [Shewanella sp. NIFS-20-20]|uniref:tetratricopeptide repeat protein n=1 Tax=Shewanella sp. NIFS-20-20 TaxID=2853806 RepID=UPI00210A96EF|nr:tetratricopeptide repeat protein [Shewanella sp. NIFS-20-20]
MVNAAAGPRTQELKLSSVLLGAEAAAFTVSLPAGFDPQSGEHYALLLELHPRAQPLLAGMHDWMSHNGSWPWLKTIIITAPDGHQGLASLKRAAIYQRGNHQLLDFFEQALLPAVDAQYPTNGFRIINGFGGNAGLVLYTLFNHPQLFNGYIAASPALADEFAYVLADGESRLQAIASAVSARPVFLQISTSDSEFEQGQLASFERLNRLLTKHAPRGLNWQSKRLDGSYYMSQAVLATAYGIEFIFNDVHQTLAPTSSISQQWLKAIMAYYQVLSEQVYGFDVSPISSLIARGQWLEQQDSAQAANYYQQCIERFPTHHSLRYQFAQVLRAQGRDSEAAKQLQQAVANTNHPFWINKYQQALAELTAVD